MLDFECFAIDPSAFALSTYHFFVFLIRVTRLIDQVDDTTLCVK